MDNGVEDGQLDMRALVCGVFTATLSVWKSFLFGGAAVPRQTVLNCP